MSSHQRKRPGGAVGSSPARKRSRLLPSSAGGTSQTEPRDLEESGAPAFEPEVIDLTGEDTIDPTGEEVIDLTGEDVIDVSGEEGRNVSGEEGRNLRGEDIIDVTGESSEPEVITISDDESPVDREQSQQQPHLSASAESLAREDEEEQYYFDNDYRRLTYEHSFWSDEEIEDREQNQQHPRVSSAAGNSADLLARDDEEEPRDVDGAQPARPASPPASEDEDSEEWELPQFLRRGENSAEQPARNTEEEPRDNQGRWPDSVYVSRFWMHYYSEWWYLRRQPHFVRAEDNSAVLVMGNNEEEQRDDDNAQPARPASPPSSEDEDSEFLEVHGQERRNVTLNSQEQVDGSGNGTGANDAPVADSAPAEQGAEEEDAESSDSGPSSAQQGVVIRCPICMEFYSQFAQRGRQLMSTLCGHVFCSRCLPLALEVSHMCPTCRVELSPELYHPVYL